MKSVARSHLLCARSYGYGYPGTSAYTSAYGGYGSLYGGAYGGYGAGYGGYGRGYGAAQIAQSS